ncbi:ribonuclease H family protein [Christiangramia sp. SM2212]|uniref:Ribonuclease H n=1 Tax=Christiangramia sediminicola TaxID=3073267 RepID=A0ABU1ET21_9FLAO|nr:ribonuclease H family protein [Christiangramia sp. SM2212]MDR5591137.1 ribonuclease H family protein [Christiangramia sp. SM2212]
MAKKKYYVVWEGRNTGILESWDECTKSTQGYKGAKFKSFKSLELAKIAYSEEYDDYKGKSVTGSELSKEEIDLIGKPNLDSISVDAACSGNPGNMEFKGVDTKTKQIIFQRGPYNGGTNNIGEFLAIVLASAILKKNKDLRPIYTDSKVAMGWVKYKNCGSYLEQNENNKEIFELIKNAEEWLENSQIENKIIKWETKAWGEIPADYGRK